MTADASNKNVGVSVDCNLWSGMDGFCPSKSDISSGKKVQDFLKLRKCNQCDKTFSQNSSLKSHLLVHTGEKPFVCDQCDQSFSRITHLKRHKYSHIEEKEFMCEQCKKRFSEKATLKSHKLSHTEYARSLKCDQCGKKFYDKKILKSHLATHSGEKPFLCDKCEQAFPRKFTLKIHQYTHSKKRPFSCEDCDNTFAQKSHLKNHISTHKKERLFACDQCEKSFNRKSHLKSHNLTHTRPKPFSCDQCSMAFLYSTQLKSHDKQIHVKNFVQPEDFSVEPKKLYEPKKTLFLVEVKDIKEPDLDETVESPFLCFFCDQTFTKTNHLEEHHQNHLVYNDLVNKVISLWMRAADHLQRILLFLESTSLDKILKDSRVTGISVSHPNH